VKHFPSLIERRFAQAPSTTSWSPSLSEEGSFLHCSALTKIDSASLYPICGTSRAPSPTFIHNFANTKIDSASLYVVLRTVGDAGPYKLPIFSQIHRSIPQFCTLICGRQIASPTFTHIFAKTKIDSTILYVVPQEQGLRKRCRALWKADSICLAAGASPRPTARPQFFFL